MHLSDVRPPEQPSSDVPAPSLWQNIGQSLGRVFKAIISFSASLLDLTTRITNAAITRLFKSVLSNEQFSPSVKAKVFSQPLLENNQENKKIVKEDEDLEKDLEELFPSSQSSSPVQSLQPPQSSPTPIAKENQPEPKPVKVETPHIVLQLPLGVVNVPDDGNCLLYAIGVGLRTKYAEYPDIQNKLKWDISAEKLEEVFNTSKLTEGVESTKKLEREQATQHLVNFLEAPGKQLRQQAADYLKMNLEDEDIWLALFDGIGSHLEVARKKIEEEQSIISILMMDIEELNSRTKTQLVRDQLKEKEDHLKAVQSSIAFQTTNLPSNDDLAGYIDMTKKDHVYCGIPQLFALCKFYDIPIRVLYNYGKANQYALIYNEEVNKKRNSPLPILTVAHVNENHFKFIND